MKYLDLKKELEKDGFKGFKTIKEMMKNPNLAPTEKGVYMILRNSEKEPEFLKIGTGGHFKEKDPNVSLDELKKNWIAESPILYIGKAGDLQSRLNQYMKFGQGVKIGHWGGRYIWQLKDAKELIVCWKTIDNEDKDPKEVEKDMIENFKKEHNGNRPFANLQD